MTEKILEPQREIPVRSKVDVVVVGGGPAGIAAAISSAREGAKTLLVERYGYLGGMMTGSYVTAVLGMGDGERQIIQGIAQEIHDRLDSLDINACEPVNKIGDYNTDAEIFKWYSIKMLEEAGAKILLHSLACSVIKENNYVRGIIVESKSGREAIFAKVVVDATADGDIACFAGAPYELSRYDVTLIMSVTGIVKEKVEDFKNKNLRKYEELILKAKKLNGGVLPEQLRYIKGYDVTDVNHLTEIEIETRKSAMESLIFLRKNLPGYEDAKISMTAPQLGVRESRRIKGEYTLSEEDILNNHKFPDSISRCGAHMVGYETYGTKGLEYDIPYRCLVPVKIEGLLCAGRCISTTHEAMNSMRLIGPCFATGQAAGVAAAIASRQNIYPRDISIDALQKRLKSQNVYMG
ncbi:MAG: hypothetical protein BWK74_07315 [Desulfobacteraceae bacterium A6]|nr:MAG: hypothetical protein BWK74_07315 [Desulfobacteraceae bacterium A6]